MASESVVLGGDVNTTNQGNEPVELEGNAFCYSGLKFALAATIILPIVGQMLSVSQLISGRKKLKSATALGITCYILAIATSIIYVASILYLFSNRPNEIPAY